MDCNCFVMAALILDQRGLRAHSQKLDGQVMSSGNFQIDFAEVGRQTTVDSSAAEVYHQKKATEFTKSCQIEIPQAAAVIDDLACLQTDCIVAIMADHNFTWATVVAQQPLGQMAFAMTTTAEIAINLQRAVHQ